LPTNPNPSGILALGSPLAYVVAATRPQIAQRAHQQGQAIPRSPEKPLTFDFAPLD